jgi:hypothetical protein
MNKSLIFLLAMHTRLGCSVSKLPKEQDDTRNTTSVLTLPKYSIIITSNDLQADRSLVLDVLMKATFLIIEVKELAWDGMRGQLTIICKGDTKSIETIRTELRLTGQVAKVTMSRQF